jgi:uncharacterized membrane protein YeaQ/YmgE (transglycosylase-associated protein family)
MGIIPAIIVGLIIGAIAKFLMPGKDPGGWIVTILPVWPGLSLAPISDKQLVCIARASLRALSGQ